MGNGRGDVTYLLGLSVALAAVLILVVATAAAAGVVVVSRHDVLLCKAVRK